MTVKFALKMPIADRLADYQPHYSVLSCERMDKLDGSGLLGYVVTVKHLVSGYVREDWIDSSLVKE